MVGRHGNPLKRSTATAIATLQSAGPWLPLSLITLLALAVRLIGLGSKSLWMDETHSFYFASQPLSSLFSQLCDPHPPGYYALLHLVLALGQNEYWLRLPSVIAATLTVPLIYTLSRDLGPALEIKGLDRHIGLLSALLLAVAPLHVWYAQEARMYALVTLLGLCAVLLAVRSAAQERIWSLLGYVLAATAALLVDQTALLPLLLANLLWVWIWMRHKQSGAAGSWQLVRWVGLQLIVGSAFWLWWSQALFRSEVDGNVFYQLTMVQLVLERSGLSIDLTKLWWAGIAGALLVVGVSALSLVLLVRSRWSEKLTRLVALGLVLFFVLLTVGSAVPRLYTFKRLVISLWPYVMVLCAWAMQRLQLKRWQISTLVIFSLALCAVNIFWAPKQPWRDIVSLVEAELGPNDVLWVDELAVPAFDYYANDTIEWSIWRASQLNAVAETGEVGHVVIVAAVDPYRNLLNYLPASWQAIEEIDWHHARLRVFVRSQLQTDSDDPQPNLPAWLLSWPSPLHEACTNQE
jgi:4-amino-4-deoxy-L-arabinose transferase-like glycosyltransferase